ncbi:MAG: hypothetical protein IIT65_00640, partial [Lachnospiraceae bacterium]|nr:hypothetical protein [Lachnospiraceae bacterium]
MIICLKRPHGKKSDRLLDKPDRLLNIVVIYRNVTVIEELAAAFLLGRCLICRLTLFSDMLPCYMNINAKEDFNIPVPSTDDEPHSSKLDPFKPLIDSWL